MSYSENEVATLASKAARGVGAPVQQAGEFGRAAAVHLQADRDVLDLRRALVALPLGPIIDLPRRIQAIAENARGGRAEAYFETGGWVPLARSYVECLPYEAMLNLRMELLLDLTLPVPRRTPARIELSDEIYAEWTEQAQRTMVPDSEASRNAGAGAGLTDND
ncbi:hypothetical protein [Sulfitobacter sp. S190]|uniref:hypothetical protein n=1 Tax=Sulfitobacter sp. S190 TaxID=2867022 RepID=UPI0021A41843|nr:hypothetical protein [Sulfitobacter sp. S190]UWR23356.1 hypothetical protein K3756_05030 [Sulfitobacter sp. S190]